MVNIATKIPQTATGISKTIVVGILINDYNAILYKPFMCFGSILS
jgi:hypothetical protein